MLAAVDLSLKRYREKKQVWKVAVVRLFVAPAQWACTRRRCTKGSCVYKTCGLRSVVNEVWRENIVFVSVLFPSYLKEIASRSHSHNLCFSKMRTSLLIAQTVCSRTLLSKMGKP